LPQIIAGTASDLTKTVSVLVKEVLENQWPISAFDPVKADIGFGLDTWDDYGDIDIHVAADRTLSRPTTIGWRYSKVIDTVTVNLFVRKVQDEIPQNMGNAQRKIEEIIKDNAGSLGDGVQMIRWEGWNSVALDNNLKDVWHAIGRASAIYFKVKV
jgi:hypothetical protein